MNKHGATKTPWYKDWPLLAAERVARQVYWSSPRLRSLARRWQARRQPAPQVADRRQFKDYLRNIGVVDGALVMAHTSIAGVCLTEEADSSGKSVNSLLVARQVLDDLLELLGPSGTLVIPAHAIYQGEEESARLQNSKTPVKYDPAATPCAVGLINELFWRRKGVLRSLHPYNSVAACGPLANELLRDNLNDSKPLPHGVHSAYYRFCQKNGMVIGIGIPLGRFLTLLYTAAETLDERWPLPGFFAERQYVVRVEGQDKLYTVRQQSSEYAMYCMCSRKFHRDLLAEDILHQSTVGTLRVDWARSADVLEYLLARNRTSSYPYYWPWLIRKPTHV
jgi:aminoglycoside N3'-acetyltransferase